MTAPHAPPLGGVAAAARRFASIAGIAVAAVGLMVLIGWSFGIEDLKAVYGEITMKANTALAFIAAGVSLRILSSDASPRLRAIGVASAGIAFLIGAATLAEHLFGWNLGIDELLFHEAPGAPATASPGRMGPPASFSFACTGLALLLLYRSGARSIRLAQALSLAVLVVAMLTAIGYLYQVQQLYGLARYSGIALHTALGLLVLSLGLLAARPASGFVGMIMHEAAGGVMARRLLVAGVLAPILLGWLVLLGENAEGFDIAFGTAALVVALIAVFAAVVWTSTAHINRAEAERNALYRSELAARGEVERAIRIKDEFLATLSHELRTPLNAILGWTAILRRSPSDPGALNKGLEVIERNARAQAQLTDDLLDMSRIISGKLRLDVQEVNVAEVIAAAVESIQPAADAKQIRLTSVVDPRAGPVVGDPNRLQQVVWNLLINAIKFTARGGRVQIALRRIDSHIDIEVSDTGIGIEPAFLPYVFDRFRQADGSFTRRQGGLGLGLALVKNLVELHGGTVRADSAGVDAGATFTVSIPVAAAYRQDRMPRSPVVEPPLAGIADSIDLSGVRVLVIDDEPDARTLIARMLADCRAEVSMADSARGALEILTAWRPAVLVCDIGMPHTDGYELLRMIRKQEADANRHTPAIALTAYARAEDRSRALLSGFQIHIAKPVQPAELLAAVANLANRTG